MEAGDRYEFFSLYKITYLKKIKKQRFGANNLKKKLVLAKRVFGVQGPKVIFYKISVSKSPRIPMQTIMLASETDLLTLRKENE